MGRNKLFFVDRVEILGRVFTSNLSSQAHIDSRISNSRRAMFSIGLNNEALSPRVKAHLWKHVEIPSLTYYALGTCFTNKGDLKRLESFQGTLIKNCLYLNKRCHHSPLLQALNIESITSIALKQRLGLIKRVFSVTSPYTKLVTELISIYIATGKSTRGTLVGQLVESGISPLNAAFNHVKTNEVPDSNINYGLVDSIRYVTSSAFYPGDTSHTLLYNLCKF